MKPSEYAVMAAAEDGHWWYRCLRGLVVDALAGAGLPEKARLLDAGCGTGGALAAARARFAGWELVGVDAADEAVERARARGLDARKGTINALPFFKEFDAALCLDVLCHGQVEPAAALEGLYRALKPGGLLVINVPAFAALKGRHDAAVGNTRRFTAGDLGAGLSEAGFTVERAGYWNLAMTPALLAWRLLTRVLPGESSSDLAELPSFADAGLYAVARLELALARGARLPAGSSAFVVARATGLRAAVKTRAGVSRVAGMRPRTA